MLEDVESRFADGAVWVALGPLSDPGLVLPAIAQAVDVIESGESPLIDRLAEMLRCRRVLLVLGRVVARRHRTPIRHRAYLEVLIALDLS